MATGTTTKAELGRKFLLYIDLASSTTEASEVWERVSMQRDATLTMGSDLVDVSSKDDSGFSRDVATRKTWSVSHSGNLDTGSATEELILRLQTSQATTDYELHVMLIDPAGRRHVGWARVESVEMSFGESEVCSLSLSLKGQGVLTRRLS